MNTLYNTINLINKQNTNDIRIDGHIHLFDSNDNIMDKIKYISFDKFIGFIDIGPRNIGDYKDVSNLYKNFIKTHYDPNKYILLVSGTSIENIIDTYNKHPNIYKGFGELKCYDYFKGEKIGLKSTKLIKDVCKFSSEVGNLPVYIHFSLTRKEYVKRLKHVLKAYPNIPIVLCHCGMEERYNYTNNIIHYDNNDIYKILIELMKQYSNLWADLTFTAADFFKEKPFLIYNLDMSRIIIGTDLNPIAINKNHTNKNIRDYNILSGYCNNTENVYKLFNLNKSSI